MALGSVDYRFLPFGQIARALPSTMPFSYIPFAAQHPLHSPRSWVIYAKWKDLQSAITAVTQTLRKTGKRYRLRTRTDAFCFFRLQTGREVYALYAGTSFLYPAIVTR